MLELSELLEHIAAARARVGEGRAGKDVTHARGVVLREFLVDVWLQAADIAQHCARLTRGREHISKVLAAGASHPSPSGEAILRRTLNPKP